ncbi:TonB-dependent receptor [Vibrio ponticus]|uniref:TonB-dependent receptor n=1 Tax=Vibrio ponticus TaxID=265668 RepID=A0A3N3DT98_9VIBR|nr:TonB-dependent receptor [Vibrio ponticus]ROV57685.1 TonB-dependent receptor [Vibrio ponticus]
MNRSILAVTVGSLLSYAPYSLAETADETVVVTANRFEQEQSTVLTSVDLIEREFIESSQATSALELIKLLPGVTVTTLGSKGNEASIYIRGTATKHALVIVDGVKINSVTNGGASIGLIPAFAIEKIEVVKGPRASIYGSDAIGGVISITTMSQEDKHVAQGGLGTDDQQLLGWHSSGRISEDTIGSFVYSKEQSDGYRIYDLAPKNETHGYDTETIFGHLNHQLSDRWSVFANGYSTTSASEYAGLYDGVKGLIDRDFYSFAVGTVFENESYRSELQVNTSKEENANGNAAGTSAKSTLTAYRNNVSWVNTYTVLSNTVLNFGADYYEEKANRGGTNTTDYEKTKKDNSAVFIASRIDFSPVSLELSTRYDDDSAFGGQTTWNAAFGFSITESIQAIASTGTAFKAPTINDLYWPESPWDKGNPNLKPEESESTELSFRGFHDAIDWSITAYKTDVDNLIEWGPEPVTFKYVPSNVAKAEIEGLEVAVNFSTGFLDHGLTAEWLDAKDAKTREDLIRRPQEKFGWNIGFTEAQFEGLLSVLYTGERKDKSGEMLEAYTTVDVGLGYLVTERLKLALRANNVLDENYNTAFGTGTSYYFGEGRTFLATATYQF